MTILELSTEPLAFGLALKGFPIKSVLIRLASEP